MIEPAKAGEEIIDPFQKRRRWAQLPPPQDPEDGSREPNCDAGEYWPLHLVRAFDAAAGGRAVFLMTIRQWRIIERVDLIETSVFTRQITALLSDDECGAFQSRLATNSGLGPLIKGGGGIRKIRVAVGARGKRGGVRIIYY